MITSKSRNPTPFVVKHFIVEGIGFDVTYPEVPRKQELRTIQLSYEDIYHARYVPSQFLRQPVTDDDYNNHQWIRSQINSGYTRILDLLNDLNQLPRRSCRPSFGPVPDRIVDAILIQRGINSGSTFSWTLDSLFPLSTTHPPKSISSSSAVPEAKPSKESHPAFPIFTENGLVGTSFGSKCSVQLRLIHATDIPRPMLPLFGDLVERSLAPYYRLDCGEWNPKSKLCQLVDVGTWYLVAVHEENEDCLAFLQWELTQVSVESPELGLFILELAVRPDFKSQGLATALMRAIEYIGHRLGCTRSDLVVQRSNLRALSFYRYLGYGMASTHQDMHEKPRSVGAFNEISEFYLRKRLDYFCDPNNWLKGKK